MEKRSQKERLTIAYELLSSVWEEYCNGLIEEGNGQIAVYIETNINRILWKLNALLNEDIEDGSEHAESRWIPCSERLPGDYQDVLVWFEYYRYGSYNRMYSTYGIGTYSKQYDSWMINHESGWKDLRVIAWMPLPEPYKGRQE